MQVAKYNPRNVCSGNIGNPEKMLSAIRKNERDPQPVNRNTVSMRMPIIIPLKNPVNEVSHYQRSGKERRCFYNKPKVVATAGAYAEYNG